MNTFDGILLDSTKSNYRESVKITLSASGITIQTRLTELNYGFNEIDFSAGGNNKKLIFIQPKAEKDICFYTSDFKILKNDFLKSNPDSIKQINQIGNTRKTYWIVTSSILLAFVGIIALLFIFKNQLIEKAAHQVPIKWEKKVGDQLFKSVTFQHEFIKNDSLQEILEKIALPLTNQLKKEGTNVEFYFIKDPSINAFALPGGKVVIHSGLIEHATSWEEVLGVLGHELAHVSRRHHLRGIINNVGLFGVLSVFFGDISAIVGTLANTGGELASLSNSREFETEADETGVDYLLKAHINPNGLISFFKILEKEHSSKTDEYLSFLSTHPTTKNRIAHIKQYIKTKGATNSKIKLDFNSYKNAFNQIK